MKPVQRVGWVERSDTHHWWVEPQRAACGIRNGIQIQKCRSFVSNYYYKTIRI